MTYNGFRMVQCVGSSTAPSESKSQDKALNIADELAGLDCYIHLSKSQTILVNTST